jgi:hypothetical protein
MRAHGRQRCVRNRTTERQTSGPRTISTHRYAGTAGHRRTDGPSRPMGRVSTRVEVISYSWLADESGREQDDVREGEGEGEGEAKTARRSARAPTSPGCCQAAATLGSVFFELCPLGHRRRCAICMAIPILWPSAFREFACWKPALVRR